MISPDRTEIYRYLGYRGLSPDYAVDALIDDCIGKTEAVIRPASAVGYFDVVTVGEDAVQIGDMVIHSHSLYRNMRSCTRAAMFAATIGHGADMLIRRAELGSMLKASVMQAVGAAYVEALCDEVNEDIRRTAAEQGYSCKPRFSPGYGDLPLDLQRDFERLLSMRQRLGITLTDSLLMVPSKSVTAFVGMYRGEGEVCTDIRPCSDCDMHGRCSYSKDVDR